MWYTIDPCIVYTYHISMSISPFYTCSFIMLIVPKYTYCILYAYDTYQCLLCLHAYGI
jgi:hypothetical protein